MTKEEAKQELNRIKFFSMGNRGMVMFNYVGSPMRKWRISFDKRSHVNWIYKLAYEIFSKHFDIAMAEYVDKLTDICEK